MQLGLPFEPDRAPAGTHPGTLPSASLGAASGSPADTRVPEASSPPPSRSPLFVHHPRARRYIIRVRGDGVVRVTIPRGGSKREARAFVDRQAHWIERQQKRLAREEASRPAPVEAGAARQFIERARRELPERLLALAEEHGLRVRRISIRNQRSRWGSCSPGGHICLNWRLVQMPPDVRDYVMIHELMHLKRMDHSPKFWALVEKACPGFRDARRWLRTWVRDAAARR